MHHVFESRSGHPRRTMRRHVIAMLVSGLALLLPLVAAAGDGSAAPISVTEGASHVQAVSAGGFNTCALRTGGSLECWGAGKDYSPDDGPNWGQSSPPPASRFLSVSAGFLHACGVNTGGNVICWGENSQGQSDSQLDGPYVAVSAGFIHTCGLKADGTVHCWGWNAAGQAGDHDDGPYVAVSAGGLHTCALRANGSLNCWGFNDVGQTDAPADGPYLALSTAGSHNCGLKANGSVKCWGSNHAGQTDAPIDGPYLAVSAGAAHTCGLKADRSVHCWGATGDNDFGQAGDHADGPYLAVSAEQFHSCGLKADGSVNCWGAVGEFDGEPTNYGQAADQDGPFGFGQIATGNAHACQIGADGTLTCWGNNDETQATPPSDLFSQVVAGDGYSCGIKPTGAATCWGGEDAALFRSGLDSFQDTGYRQLALGAQRMVCGVGATGSMCANSSFSMGGSVGPTRNITSDYATSLDTNTASLCGVAADGTGFCKASIDGAATASNAAIPAGPWQRLESGLAHQCGLKADGTLQCWGDNAQGQTNNVPTGLFRALSVGWNHACAIKGNGTLACWGSNLNAQATAPAGKYVQVVAGNTFTCAIRDDGVRVCWGDDAHGQVPQLELTPITLPDAALGQFYIVDFSLGTIAGDYVPPTPGFAVVSGSLPPYFYLYPEGRLAGGPLATGTFTFTVEGEDANGFAASRSYTLKIISDTTPPAISYAFDPTAADGSNGWYVSDVGIDWTVADPDSAISSSTGCDDNSAALTNDSAGTSFTCSANSAGGNNRVTTATIKRDATVPTLVAAATTAPNGSGWYAGDVTVHFTCTDALSGVASCPADQTLTDSGSSTSQTTTDNAGNVSAASNVVAVQIDRTPPSISYVLDAASPDGDNGWYVSDVDIDWTISDAGGIASSTGCSDSTLSTDTLGASYTCTAEDNAGNSDSVATSTIKRDATAPTLAPTVPSPILRDGSDVASPNAGDATSGVASASCGPLDTSSTGDKMVTCIASDNAGNTNSVDLDYTVSTSCTNDGYTGTKLSWCKNVCENGLSGRTLDTWIHRWVSRYRDLPYCRIGD